MQFILSMAIGLFLSLPWIADAKPSHHEYCKDQAKAAGVLMKARQDGILLQDLMNALNGEKEKTILLMVDEAYRRPISPTNAGKKAAIDEFQNQMYATCIKAAN
jgi:hypothetical protein